MSVGTGAVGEQPIADSSAAAEKKAPAKRQVTAKADPVQQPEAR